MKRDHLAVVVGVMLVQGSPVLHITTPVIDVNSLLAAVTPLLLALTNDVSLGRTIDTDDGVRDRGMNSVALVVGVTGNCVSVGSVGWVKSGHVNNYRAGKDSGTDASVKTVGLYSDDQIKGIG